MEELDIVPKVFWPCPSSAAAAASAPLPHLGSDSGPGCHSATLRHTKYNHNLRNIPKLRDKGWLRNEDEGMHYGHNHQRVDVIGCPQPPFRLLVMSRTQLKVVGQILAYVM